MWVGNKDSVFLLLCSRFLQYLVSAVVLALLPRSPLTGFLAISLFNTTSETWHEAAGSAHFEAAVIERSLGDWDGSQKREKADLLVAFPSNDCVPPGHQLQEILGSPVWLYHAVCSARHLLQPCGPGLEPEDFCSKVTCRG